MHNEDRNVANKRNEGEQHLPVDSEADAHRQALYHV